MYSSQLKYFIGCILLIGLSGFAELHAQQWSWSHQETVPNTSSSCLPQANATNNNGDVFITGTYSGSSTIGGVPMTPIGTSDMYVVKYNNTGVGQWTVGFGSTTTGTEYTYCAAADTSGNVYVGGIVNTTFTVGSVTVNPAVSRGFLLKFNANGIAQWVRMLGSAGSNLTSPTHLVFDAANNRIIAGGTYWGTGTFGSYTLNGPGAQESYIAAVDAASGTVQWASNVARSTGTDPLNAIAIDDNGNIFAASDFGSSTVTIGNQPFTFSNGGSCIAKFRNNGSYVNCYATTKMDFHTLGFNRVTGEVYSAGEYYQSFTEGIFTLNHLGLSTNPDIFVCRIDTFLQPVSYTWMQSIDDDYAYTLCATDDGMLLGIHGGGPLLTQSNVYNTNGYIHGMVYMKLDEGLHVMWAKTIVGGYYAQRITAISSAGNYIYMSVHFNGSITCNNISANSLDVNSLTVRLNDEHMNYSASVGGWVFNDNNSNGDIDSSENYFHHYHMLRNRTDSMLMLTDVNGHYFTTVLPGTNEFEIVQIPLYHTQVFPVSPLYNSVSATSGNYIDSVNFGLLPASGVQDMEIKITGPSGILSGSPVRYYVDYFNRGTDTMTGYVVMNCDPGLNFVQAIPPADSVSGNQLFWNYAQMIPLDGDQIQVDFTCSILPINSPVNCSVIVEPVLGDTAPANNYDSIALMVFGPHDPNNKVVFPEGGITPLDVAQGNWLDYVIHFQNVGTASAINIVIRDTLSTLLDLTTFGFLSASAPVRITLLPDREIEFRFDSINLPDSASDLLGSQGFIRFRIKPVTTAVVGNVIKNDASIYFDYEFPVVTNSTSTPIQVITVSETITGENILHVFPNPAGEIVTIESATSIQSVAVVSITGALISQYNFASGSGTCTIPLNGLPAGVIILKVVTSAGESYVRLVIQ